MDFLYNLLDQIYDELDKLSRKEMTTECLEHIEKLSHSAKSIETILAMKESGSRNSYTGNYNYRDSYDDYEGGNSGRRGRDSRGRYTTTRMYRDSDRDNMMGELRRRLQSAKTEEEKKAYRFVINTLEKE